MQRVLLFQLEGAAELLSKDWTSTQTFRRPPGLNHALRLLNHVQKCQTPSRLPERALCFAGVFQCGCLELIIPPRITKMHTEKYWTKRGVACLLQLDD